MVISPRWGGTQLAMNKLIPLLITGIALSACSIFEEEKEPPLPGERIAVLRHERSLTADASLADQPILLPAPSPNAEWPQSGGFPNHAMHHIAVRDALDRVWSVDIGTGTSDEERLSGEPVIAGGVVYAIDAEATVSAFDAKTGGRIWEVDLTPDFDDDGHISGGLAFDEGRLFATTGFAQIVALDAKSGAEIWRTPAGAPMRSAPTARGGRVFAVTVDNRLLALNAETGEQLWDHSGIPETASVLGGASPAVDRGTVIVPYSSGQLVALKVDTGRVIWEDSLTAIRRTDVISTLAHIRGRPIIDRGVVIAMSHGGQIAAIDLATGKRIWDRDIGGLESPWVAGDYVFILTNEAEVAGLSRKDGRIHWVTALPRYEDPEDLEDPIIWTGPILASDRLVIAGSNGQALAISPYSGKILGSVDMPDGVSIPPVVADGSVFFLADDAELVAYR